VKGGNPAHLKAALKAGLVVAQDVVLQRQVPPAADVAPAPPAAAVVPPQVGAEAMVVDRPLRSGQQVYARGRDLVVLAMVNPGAEVIADGHVHVYAPLRGKAIAGARGNGDARIFALSMEPELVSIAGIYRTSDVPLPADVSGKPAMVRLASGPEGDKLWLEAMRG
jgi:septum site-determining protein MinC